MNHRLDLLAAAAATAMGLILWSLVANATTDIVPGRPSAVVDLTTSEGVGLVRGSEVLRG